MNKFYSKQTRLQKEEQFRKRKNRQDRWKAPKKS